MNPFDAAVLALVLLGLAAGALAGFVAQVARLLALAGGLVAARIVSPEAARAVRAIIPGLGPPVDRFAGFVAVFLLAAAAIVIAGAWARDRVRASALAPVDRLGGAIVGGTKGLLVAYVGLFIVICFPSAPLKGDMRASTLAPVMLDAIGATSPMFPPEFLARGRDEAVRIAALRAKRSGAELAPHAVPAEIPALIRVDPR